MVAGSLGQAFFFSVLFAGWAYRVLVFPYVGMHRP